MATTRVEDGVTVDAAEPDTSTGGSNDKVVVVGITREGVDNVPGCSWSTAIGNAAVRLEYGSVKTAGVNVCSDEVVVVKKFAVVQAPKDAPVFRLSSTKSEERTLGAVHRKVSVLEKEPGATTN